MSEEDILKFGGSDNMTMAQTFGELSAAAPLCNFRTKEWGARIRVAIERGIRADATLTDEQKYNLLLLIAVSARDAEQDWRKDSKTECGDIEDDLSDGDRILKER
jgi:hypothetical protein